MSFIISLSSLSISAALILLSSSLYLCSGSKLNSHSLVFLTAGADGSHWELRRELEACGTNLYLHAAAV
jgi:hypothetical protein